MFTFEQLKKDAVFISDEFNERIIITKETPKMVWYFNRRLAKNHMMERRISKDDMLTLLDALNFITYDEWRDGL